MFIKFFIRKVH